MHLTPLPTTLFPPEGSTGLSLGSKALHTSTGEAAQLFQGSVPWAVGSSPFLLGVMVQDISKVHCAARAHCSLSRSIALRRELVLCRSFGLLITESQIIKYSPLFNLQSELGTEQAQTFNPQVFSLICS